VSPGAGQFVGKMSAKMGASDIRKVGFYYASV